MPTTLLIKRNLQRLRENLFVVNNLKNNRKRVAKDHKSYYKRKSKAKRILLATRKP